MSARILALVVALSIVLVAPLRAASANATDEQTKTAARHILIALRVLSYDKQLSERGAGSTATVVLVSSPTAEGRAMRDVFERGFALMPKVKVGGRAVRVISLDAANEKAFAKALAGTGATAVMIVDDVGVHLGAIRVATRAQSVLSISMREADARHGVAVAIVEARERDQIVINVAAARAERVRFGAGLLQLARIVEEAP